MIRQNTPARKIHIAETDDRNSWLKQMTELETLKRIQSVEYTSGSSAYHLLQRDVERLELSDGSTVARIESSVIGDPIVRESNIAGFAETLSDEFPSASMFHIEQQTAAALQVQGYKISLLGVESKVSLPFSLQGKDKSDLRRALNRSTKAGVIVSELDASEFVNYSEKISTLNQRWIEARRCFTREFCFLARPFVEAYQPGERRFVAFQAGRPVGIAVYDPVYRSGVLVGYFEAIVRCFVDSLAGTRDHLTLAALEIFATVEDSAEWVSLGLSPFAPMTELDQFSDSTPVTSLTLSLFYRFGDSVFNCRGLKFHKDRYRGVATPVYFATKNLFPLAALYRACRISHLDPLSVPGPFVITVFRVRIPKLKIWLLSALSKIGIAVQPKTNLASSEYQP